MSDRPAGPKQSFSQQVVWALTRRGATASPLSSAATASSPAQHPIDHHNLQDAISQITSGSSNGSQTPINPFDEAAVGRPPSPISLDASRTDTTEGFAAHVVELLKPLPLNQPRRDQTIQERASRIQILAKATADHAKAPPPPQGQILRLVVALLGRLSASDSQPGGELLPDTIREASIDLLTEAVRLSDTHASDAPKALIETRSGAPGSQSSKSLDSDQPLATIDRALLYRLVVEDQHRSLPLEADGSLSPSLLRFLPTADNLGATALPCLHAKLRALETLSQGGREVVAFDNIVKLLSTWLAIVWQEVQALRQLVKYVSSAAVQPPEAKTSPVQSSQRVDRQTYVEQLSAREWSLSAIFHLLTSILMFSFAKVDQAHIQGALRTAALLFTAPLPREVVIRSGSPGARRASLIAASQRNFPSASAALSPRSISRDRRKRQPSLEGYSYYGMESFTPESAASTANSPALTPKLDPLTDRGISSAAPISLATLPPAATINGTTKQNNANRSSSRSLPRSRLSSFVSNDEDSEIPAFSELQDVEVRCVIKLLDAALRFGYLPAECISAVCEMLCRILGFEPTLAAVVAPNGLSAMAHTLAIADLTTWQELTIPVLANLLRSHSANTCIQKVRAMLMRYEDEREQDLDPKRVDEAATIPETDRSAIEDEATLVGAVLWLRFALLIIAKESQTSASGTTTSGAQGGAAGGHSSSTQAATSSENALAPRLSLALLLPALRGALHRGSDLVDLQVISLVEALLVPAHNHGDGKAASLAPGGSLTVDDWNELLQLTTVAKRHTDVWRGSILHSSNLSEVRLPAVLHALIGLLSRLTLVSGDHLGPVPTNAEPGQVTPLPWTPRLCSLLLTLGPALPSHLIDTLVDYHWAHHLCLPCTPDWIANINALMQAFLYGPYRTDNLAGLAAKASKTWQEKSRKALTTFLFEHVYESVISFANHRARLLREVLLPVAKAFLFNEDAFEMNEKIRRVLIQAAALSSVADDGEGKVGEIFDSVRLLLAQLAREADHYPHHSSHHAHVHFADPKGSHDHRASTTTDREGPRSTNEGVNISTLPTLQASRGTGFALDLISIFNVIAFSSPWLDLDDAIVHRRDEQEKHAREACLTLFNDLLTLLRPVASPDNEGVPPGDGQSSTVLPSDRTRLAILQWFMHIRTDRHHRVYLTGNLDESVGPSAATLLKTAASRAAAAAADAQATTADKQRAARSEGREGRRATATAALDSARSKSRARDPSTERGRAAEKTSDGPRRGADRSTSASRGGSQAQPGTSAPRKPSWEHEALWQIPEVLAFEMPTTNLRSDIVYTYVHEDDPSCSHHVHDGHKPAPLPVSSLLATYIKLIESERDWELVSYLICFLPHQLANKHLFCGPKAREQVLVLRSHLCSTIDQQKLMPDLHLPDDIKRSDIYAVVYATLTTLLSYKILFSRTQQEEMVDAFVAGLNKSQNTALPCVRALSVAVYEAQKSVTRLLPKILVKLSTIMSSMTMSVHILELIASIGQIPACYANFTEADYRRVFGIALQYIQYHQSPAGSGREDFRSSPASFALSQYVMMLAYYDISLWFMTLRLSERPKHVSAITRGLLLANEGREQLSDNSEVCFDFLARFTHSNADPKPTRSFMNSVVMGPNSATPAARAGMKEGGARTSKTWLIGKGLITISTLRKEGWVELIIRRASGTTALLCKLENAPVSTLPEDDGERIDLPAALMMGRNPHTIGKPVLRAPDPFLRAAPFDLAAVADSDDEDVGAERGLSQATKSLQQETREALKAGERMRSRRLAGPAHFGLGAKPRSASFSGGIDSEVNASTMTADDPYRPAENNSDKLAATEVASAAREDAIAKVMKDILDEGAKIQPSNDDEGAAPNPALRPPPKQSVERDFAIDPSTIALQLSSYPDFLNTPPILLPDEPATTRLIKAIDLTPVVDLHKIGLLYVAPGQKTEAQILGNRHGSPAYARFVAGLGDLITLRGQEDVYTGGLDREQDFHGKYAYAWSDDISQIVFHAATMMPNRAETDANHAYKKALIGNDWVHIVFNESGDEYAFGTLPSQFNYVNIVISPNTKGGTNLGSIGPVDTSFYRVSLQRRPGLPSFSPLGDDGQLISAAELPSFVRSLALNANVMSQIYNDTGESMQPYSSNWCNRLNHVVRFKRMWEEKQLKKRQEELEQAGGSEGFVVAGVGEHDPRDFTTFA